MLKNFIEVFGIILGTICCMLFLGTGLVYIASVFEKNSCTKTAEMMGLVSHYTMATRCMINVNGRWMPLKSIKIEKY